MKTNQRAKKVKERQIYFEIYIKATPKLVWDLISNPIKIPKWSYMGKASLDKLVVGGTFLFHSSNPKNTVPDKGEILAVEACKRLVYRWHSEEPEPTIVEYILKPHGKYTKLIFRNTGFISGKKWDRLYQDDYLGWVEMHLKLKRIVETC